MAHFAQLDNNNVVVRVIVVDNKDTSDANGVEKEYIGKAFCERIFGGNWIQTSYNGNMRRRFAGKGMIYNEAIDAFMAPKPYASWVLNGATAEWDPPVAKPTDGKQYLWDELNQKWVEAPAT